MIKYKIILLTYLCIFSSIDGFSQEVLNYIKGTEKLNDEIIHGVLENGMSYYIKPLDESHKGLKMIFIVKTGSDLEKPHEMDFAHHIEHLAFRETKNFPSGLKGNSTLLSQLGMKDTDVRGMTSAKMTRYWFDIPNVNGNMTAIQTGLLWFKDISFDIDLSQNNINRERGVLLQEYLAGEANQEGANIESALKSELFPCVKNYSNFVEHNKSFPSENLKEFYKKWYQPNRMSIILVGNIPNLSDVTQRIKAEFSTLENESKVIKPVDCDSLYLNSQPNFLAMKVNFKSKSNSYKKPIKIQLYFRDLKAVEKKRSLEAIERNIIMKILTSALNDRLKELEQNYNNSGSYFSYYGGKPANALKVTIQSDLLFEEKSLEKSLVTLNQFKTFGILDDELQTIKEKLLESYPPVTNYNPDYWVNEITNYIVHSESLPKGKNSHLRKFIKNLSPKDLNVIICELITGPPQDIGLIIPEGYHTDLSSEQKIRNVINNVFKKQVYPYSYRDEISQLLTEDEQNELLIREATSVKEGILGSKEYYLTNGMKVILKPSPYSKNNIVFHGFSSHGVSYLPEEDYYSAMFSSSVVTNAGVGKFSKFDLKQFYKSSNSIKMGVSPYVKYNEVGLKAQVSPVEIEKLLQVTYLYFTKPRKDFLAFEDWRAEQLFYTASTLNPNNDLIDNLNELSNDYASLPLSSRRIEAIKKVQYEKAYASYNQLFGDPSKFTFVVTGDFEVIKILPLIKKYLGNILPRENIDENRTIEKPNRDGLTFNEKKSSPLYQTQNSFYGLKFVKPGKEKKIWREELRVAALGLIANRLLYNLRSNEDFSLYFFGAGGIYNRDLERYEISFRFNCTPEERSLIIQNTKTIIQDLKKGKIPKEVLSLAKSQLLEQYDITTNSVSNLSNDLYLYYRFGELSGKPTEREDFIRNLTITDIKNTAKNYLRDELKFELVMK